MTPAWICRSLSPPQNVELGAIPPTLINLPVVNYLSLLSFDCTEIASVGGALEIPYFWLAFTFSHLDWRLSCSGFPGWISWIVLSKQLFATLEHRLHEMTDWLLLVCFKTAARIKSTSISDQSRASLGSRRSGLGDPMTSVSHLSREYLLLGNDSAWRLLRQSQF